MKRRHVLIGGAIYYLLLFVWFNLRGTGGTLNIIDFFFMLTAFPVVPIIALCLNIDIARRQAAERAHQHELDMQDRLARRIVLEMNGPVVEPETIGLHMNRSSKEAR